MSEKDKEKHTSVEHENEFKEYPMTDIKTMPNYSTEYQKLLEWTCDFGEDMEVDSLLSSTEKARIINEILKDEDFPPEDNE